MKTIIISELSETLYYYIWPLSRALSAAESNSYHLYRIDNQIISVAAAVSAIWHRALSQQSENARRALLHSLAHTESEQLSFPPQQSQPTKCNAPGVCCLLAKCARQKIDIVGVLGVENIHRTGPRVR